MTGATSNTTGQPEMVPNEWPPICVAAETVPRRVSGIVAIGVMPGLWFSPKRVGAIVAAASWRATFVAHSIAVCLGGGLIAWSEQILYVRSTLGGFGRAVQSDQSFVLPAPVYGDAWVMEWLRSPFAALVATLHGSIGIITPGATIPWVFAGSELGLIVTALLVAPFVAVGESMRLVLARSLKLSLWSTTMMVPLGIGWMCDPYVRALFDLPNVWLPVDYAVVALFAVWWLAVLLRSGSTYVGPPRGPLWEPRRPRCEACGYTIAHLDVDGRCPECARPVAMSLADRRCLPEFARAVGFAGKARAFFSTIRTVFTQETFFEGLAVLRGHREARVFVVLIALFSSGLLSIALSISKALLYGGLPLGVQIRNSGTLAEIVVAACILLFIQLAAMSLLAWLVSVFGKRPLHVAATFVSYAAVCVFPAAVGITLALHAVSMIYWAVDTRTRHDFTVALSIGSAVAFVGAIYVLQLIVGVARRALRDTRLANG